MHKLPKSRIPRIPQGQRVPRSVPLLTCRSALLRPYSSIPDPSTKGVREQSEGNGSQEPFGVDRLPPHYHITHPDLSKRQPLLDTKHTLRFPPDNKTRFANEVIFRNVDKDFTSVFDAERDRERERALESGEKHVEEDETAETHTSEVDLKKHLQLNEAERSNLFKFPLITRRITKQTGKGKIHRMHHLIVVGNGDGLVGYGEGKDLTDAAKAADKALIQAVRNMDYVERFEKRTIFGEMRTKMGSTQIILRPRPVGFGLQCGPKIHQILKAAGIKDISAKVWGSRNPINVIKALFRILHSGHAPLYMGDGVGGKGRRMYKGEPIQSRDAVERARGRKLHDLRT
jgi:small subunit ribosomal protein S5